MSAAEEQHLEFFATQLVRLLIRNQLALPGSFHAAAFAFAPARSRIAFEVG